MTTLMLIDNGSSRPAATLCLRGLAGALSARMQAPVHPVSLQHADRVDPGKLGGVPAATLRDFLAACAAQGEREFVAVPLFFGPSRALSNFVPQTAAAVAANAGPIEVAVLPPLCPLPAGEPRLTTILADQVAAACAVAEARPDAIVVVDHGSPLPAVNAVRRWLAADLRRLLGPHNPIREAVMERRAGAAYDFNGDLLDDVFDQIATDDAGDADIRQVVLAMQFIGPGSHAGQDGDIAVISAAAEARHPHMRVIQSALVGEHPLLIDILVSRLEDAGYRQCGDRY